MGMFDTFRGFINCIECNKTFEFEEQTKNYECLLSDFLLGDYIDKANKSYFYLFTTKCPHCGKIQRWTIAIKKGQIVGYFEEDKSTTELLDSLPEIEEGLARKLKYNECCEKMLGYDTENMSNINGQTFSLCQEIYALGKNWVIDGIYKEELNKKEIPERLKKFIKITFKETLIFEVHNNEIKRFIVMRDGQPVHVVYPIFEQKEHWESRDYNDRYISQNYCNIIKII